MEALKRQDPDIAKLIESEERRQFEKIRLIPSENYTSQAVLEATGSVLTNKYSEGYPYKRYYEGQEFIDEIEILAIERAKKLFKADHANVQPLSGAPANLAVYYAFMKPGDTVLGHSLPHGGHLTHGWKVSFSGKTYRAVHYGLNPETQRLDYDAIRKLAHEEKPKLIWAGASAYPRTIDFSIFAEIAKEVSAIFAADIAHIAGLVVTGMHPSPVPHADVVTTTTHKTLRGPRAGMILCKKEHQNAIDRAIFPTLQGGPHNHNTAGIAVALNEANTPKFQEYAKQVVQNAQALAERLLEHGFSLITGGTDNHLLLIDLTPMQKSGRPIAQALNRAGIVVNANAIPFDTRKPFDPSGIRLGTPSVTSRGMKEPQMKQIADWMYQVVQDPMSESLLDKIAMETREFCSGFPAPGLPNQTLAKV